MDWIVAVLLPVIGAVAGILGTLFFNRGGSKTKVVRLPEKVEPSDLKPSEKEVAEINKRIKSEMDLIYEVKNGGSPDEYLEKLQEKRRELDSRLDTFNGWE